MPSEPAGLIREELEIPVYGIGAGDQVDGQLVIMHDLIGFYHQSDNPQIRKFKARIGWPQNLCSIRIGP